MKTVTVASSAFAIICLVSGLAFFHHSAMKRAGLYNAYLALRKAHRHLIESGQVTNPSPGVAELFPYTNAFSMHGSNYNPVLGMRWKPLSSDGAIMAITRDGVVVWLNKRGSTSIITFDDGAAKAVPRMSGHHNANR
jgi:hypothetical protein